MSQPSTDARRSSHSLIGSTPLSLVLAPVNWLIGLFMALVVLSQFLGLFWSTMETDQDVMYGQEPMNAIGVITGTNDEPYTDRSLVCMAQGRSYTPMQLSQVLADPKLAPVVDTTGTSISGYRVVKRETLTLRPASTSAKSVNASTTRELLLVVDGIFSDTTKAIPRALPILIMPFWDNGIHDPWLGWHGSVFRGAPRSVRESKSSRWLGKPHGTWRNGWYEDGSGQRWSSDMMTSDVGNRFGIEARQFDTLANQEIDCVTKPVPRPCFDYPLFEKWGQQSKTWDVVKRSNQVYISNGTHFGQFMFDGFLVRVVENKYSLETFISNMSMFVLLFRWFVSMAVMANSYRRGVAPWQSAGIGCLSSSRTFNVLPIVLLPRLKMTMAAFWTVGCEFEGSQRALVEAWFAMYPAIVELMLLFYSVINILAKVTHRRVDDVLFGPTVVAFALLHHYRLQLVRSGWLGALERIPVVVTSDEFNELNLADMFAPSIAVRMNGNVTRIYYAKLIVLALNLLPLAFSENMTRSGKKYRSYSTCEIEETLALRASNIGGLGKSPVYVTLSPSRRENADPHIISTVSTGRSPAMVVYFLRSKLNTTAIMTRVTAFQDNDSVVPVDNGTDAVGESPWTGSLRMPTPRHVLIAFELDRLGYLVFGGKYLVTYEDWYILTSLAPLRVVEKLWNHRISAFEVVASDDGYLVSSTARLFRLDDEKLRSIPFYDVTISSFR